MEKIPNIVRQRMQATAVTARHPEADVLTAFAENSLSAMERENVLEHLGRCAECRDVVALALPEMEAESVVARPVRVRAGWLAWPGLRWGLAVAGVAVVASVGVVQYQKHTASSAQMAKAGPPTLYSAEKSAAPANANSDSDKGRVATQLSAPPPPVPQRVGPGVTSGVPTGRQSAEQGSAEQGSAKDALKQLPTTNQMVAAAPSPTRVPQLNMPGAGSGAMGGVIGGPARSRVGGPNPPQQWQQQAQVQAVAPAGNAQPSAAHEAESETATVADNGAADASAQPAQQFDYSSGVGKAKPVPSARAAAPSPALAKSAAAVSTVAPGQMNGLVVDPSGAVVANARITVQGSNVKAPATATSDHQGRWAIAGLPSGNYKVEATAQGFNTARLDVNYDANQAAMYRFPLSVGNVSQTVEVASAAAQLQTQAAQVGGTITGKEAQELPMNGRNFTQLTSLVPGAAQQQTYWTITAAGTLQRSFDQGKTWQDVNVTEGMAGPVNSTALMVMSQDSKAPAKVKKAKAAKNGFEFRAVAANGADVWAGGSWGLLYHSLDAGNTWTRVLPQAGGNSLSGDIVSLQFPDAQHGSVTTSGAETWTTGDGGQTWQRR